MPGRSTALSTPRCWRYAASRRRRGRRLVLRGAAMRRSTRRSCGARGAAARPGVREIRGRLDVARHPSARSPATRATAARARTAAIAPTTRCSARSGSTSATGASSSAARLRGLAGERPQLQRHAVCRSPSTVCVPTGNAGRARQRCAGRAADARRAGPASRAGSFRAGRRDRAHLSRDVRSGARRPGCCCARCCGRWAVRADGEVVVLPPRAPPTPAA